MNEIEADLAAIKARNEPVEAERRRLIGALNKGITLILCLAMVGMWFAAFSIAEVKLKTQDLQNQESAATWQR